MHLTYEKNYIAASFENGNQSNSDSDMLHLFKSKILKRIKSFKRKRKARDLETHHHRLRNHFKD